MAEEDLFLSILDEVGETLLKSTIRGGQGRDLPARLAARNNSPHVVGLTRSADFPMVGASLQGAIRGSEDGFLTIFDPSLNLTYATFLGSEGLESAESAALDCHGNILVTGSTTSDHFPVTINQAPFTSRKGSDAFICKLSQDGSDLLFAAGFEFDGESSLLANPADTYDFAFFSDVPNTRDRTDQFIFRFRKPTR